jgi:type V secretory pathway adhesin AidA
MLTATDPENSVAELDVDTTQPAAQRQWVGLTDDDVRKINQEVWGYVSADHTRMRGYAHAIEAKLKEKNT